MQPAAAFAAHRLHFELQVRETILLGQHAGSSLRGMLYRALLALTGPVRRDDGDQLEFLPNEPVRYLMATLDEDSPRGRDVPRPYAIEAPLFDAAPGGEEVRLEAGQRFTFGMTLFAHAMELFPYVLLAVKRAEDMGIGRGRGRFSLARAWSDNPFTGEIQAVYARGDQLARIPDLPITHAHVLAAPGPAGRALTIVFLSPTTLRAAKQMVTTPLFSVLVHRLIERLAELCAYSRESTVDSPQPESADSRLAPDRAPALPCLPATREAKNALLGQADQVRLARDDTRWVALNGYSARQGAPTALSGLVGPAVYEADDFSPFLPLLRWGEIAHVGKHTVKGNGLYRLSV